jgi:hypothetical protein
LTASDETSFSTSPAGDTFTISMLSGGQVATVFLSTYAFHNPIQQQDECTTQGYAVGDVR